MPMSVNDSMYHWLSGDEVKDPAHANYRGLDTCDICLKKTNGTYIHTTSKHTCRVIPVMFLCDEHNWRVISYV